MQGVYSSYAEALKEIRSKDAEIQKNFADRYGIDMKEIFNEYYKADSDGSATTDESSTSSQTEDSSEDLLK